MAQSRIHLNAPASHGSGKQVQGGQKSKARMGVLFLLAVAAVFAIWLFASGTAEEFFEAIRCANLVWLLLGALFFCLFFGLDMVCYRVAARLTDSYLGIKDLFSVAAAGIVFGFLTPGQSGAAPAQIVRLSQVGLKVGDATALQLTKFFIYQAAVTLFGAVVLVGRAGYFIERFGDIVVVCVLAFGVHVAIMLGLVAMVFFPNAVRKVCHFLVRALSGKVRIIKDPEALHAKVDSEVDGYAGSVHQAIRQGKIVGLAVAINVGQLACLYCIPFCVLRALGVMDVDFLTALCASAFIQLIMTAVPLPGGTGGAEAGFALFFGPELGGLTTAAVVLWRALSFYLPIVFSMPLLGLRTRPFVAVRGAAAPGVPQRASSRGSTSRITLSEIEAAQAARESHGASAGLNDARTPDAVLGDLPDAEDAPAPERPSCPDGEHTEPQHS